MSEQIILQQSWRPGNESFNLIRKHALSQSFMHQKVIEVKNLTLHSHNSVHQNHITSRSLIYWPEPTSGYHVVFYVNCLCFYASAGPSSVSSLRQGCRGMEGNKIDISKYFNLRCWCWTVGDSGRGVALSNVQEMQGCCLRHWLWKVRHQSETFFTWLLASGLIYFCNTVLIFTEVHYCIKGLLKWNDYVMVILK